MMQDAASNIATVRAHVKTRQPLYDRITFGKGTSHLPAFSFRFCLTVLLNTLARSTYNIIGECKL